MELRAAFAAEQSGNPSKIQDSRERKVARNSLPGGGEAPWTNMSADLEEEQSGHVHVVGFLVTHVDTQTNNKGQTDSAKKKKGFVGWDAKLVQPQGRPIPSWEYRGDDPRGSASSSGDPRGSAFSPAHPAQADAASKPKIRVAWKSMPKPASKPA